ncbi:MAG: hypothetical protein NZ534_11005, partial [Bacteroidia bacterium]|nr:hypothetical protein [Bacteroidia bacterium]
MILCGFTAVRSATLINANFETSTSATLVNDSPNRWCRGTATAFSGNYSLYISGDNCATNTYQGLLGSSVSHAYWTVNFPAGETVISLSFNWRCSGEAGYDDLRVYYQYSNPVAGSQPVGTLIGTFLGQSSWQTTNLLLPASLAGQSGVRIVFTWRNDWNLGSEPPAAIDNVVLTTAAPPTGHDCSNPIVVNSFPFNYSGNSAGFLNDYGSQSACGGNYGNGEDVVFRLNIPSAGTASINLTNTSNTGWIGWFLKSSSGCADASASLACAVSGTGNVAAGDYFFASAGTYFLIVDYWPAPDNSLFSLNINFNATIPNDECSGAITLTPGATCSNFSGTVSQATGSPGVPTCVGVANDDVWFKFTAIAFQHNITVTGSSGFDAVLQVFSGSCGNLASLACLDATGNGGVETAVLSGLSIGATYYMRVYHYYTALASTPGFSICVTTPTPSNDDCSAATTLTPGVACVQTTGTTSGATASSGIPACVGTPNNDVWFKFTATSSQH